MASDPIVIDPPGFDTKAGWKECAEYVEKCGGLTHDDGEPNWRAAFGADPGVCSCPNCGEYYWAWGIKQRCRKCAFEYPVDWWPMYSYGVQQRNREADPPPACREKHFRDYLKREHERRISHPYYRYGYEHPVKDPWAEHDKIPWKTVMATP